MTIAIDKATGKPCGQAVHPRDDQPAGTVRILTGNGYRDVDATTLRFEEVE